MEASGCKFAFFTKIDEPGANLFGPECFGRAAKVCGETGNLQQIRALCVVCEVADDHVVHHALAQRCHGETPGGSEWSARLSTSILLHPPPSPPRPPEPSTHPPTSPPDTHTRSPP